MKIETLSRAFLLILLMGSSVLSEKSQAEGEISDDMLDMSLEKLMEIEVTTVSKGRESLSSAAGVVSVIERGDIAKLGAVNLNEVLGLVVNAYSWGPTFFPDNNITIRGSRSDFNNQVLVAINSRPFRDASNGGINGVFYQTFPLELIERIEVIRGPGSVLYGSGAFTGVINIITRPANQDRSVTTWLSYGSLDEKAGALTLDHVGDSFEAITSVNALDFHGKEANYNFSDGSSYSPNLGEKHISGYFYLKHKELSLNAFSGTDQNEQMLSTLAFKEETTRQSTRRDFADLQYRPDLLANWETQFNLTYNFVRVGGSGIEAENFIGEALLRGEPFQRVQWLFGAAVENQDYRQDSVQADSLWQSYYTQVDYQVFDHWKLVAGAQLNKIEGIDADISSRFGAIFNFGNGWNLKLLYSEAFRAPSFAETSIDIGAIQGNPDLNPEVISTYDIHLSWRSDKVLSSLTYYDSLQEETINLDLSQGTLVNSGTVDYQGVEWEIQYQLANQWKANVAASYQKGEDDTGNEDVGLVPHTMVKTGLSYGGEGRWKYSFQHSYYSEAAKIEEINSSTQVLNPEADAYHWITVSGSYRLPELSWWPMSKGVELRLSVENLLDEEVYFPEFQLQAVNTNRLRAGRNFRFSLKAEF